MIYTLRELRRPEIEDNKKEVKPGIWVPARPMQRLTFWEKIIEIGMVASGKADLVIWPGKQ
jgi:hypothetical protein